MRQGERRSTLGLGLLVIGAAAAMGCAPEQEALVQPDFVQLGETLFSGESFDGNGRVCSTCHELDRFGTISPQFVQDLSATDPKAPLFRAIDSDDGSGGSYERLKEHATIRVRVELPTHEATGLSVRRCDQPASTTVILHRGVPSVFNVALETHLMHDGREGDDLGAQALAAVINHAEPGRRPASEELAAIAAFQRSLFSNEGIKQFFEKGTRLELPAGTTPSERRGRVFFEPDRECGQCHAGPMLNRTSEFHPIVIHSRFEGALVGAGPRQINERFRWCWVDPATNEVVPGPNGVPEVFDEPRHDPGLVIIPGSTAFTLPEGSMAEVPPEYLDGSRAVVPNDILAAIGGAGLYKIPTLWGTPNTAPYFHDNSARTLEEVVDQYNFFFDRVPDELHLGCAPDKSPCLSEQDKADIVDFMQLLSFGS